MSAFSNVAVQVSNAKLFRKKKPVYRIEYLTSEDLLKRLLMLRTASVDCLFTSMYLHFKNNNELPDNKMITFSKDSGMYQFIYIINQW